MDAQQLSGSGGIVRIGDLVLHVEELPFRQEYDLYQSLKRLAKEDRGDFLVAVEPMLDRLRKKGTPEAAAQAAVILQEVARMEARQELPADEAADGMRLKPKGAVLELWYRSRRLHPNLQMRDLEAIITDANTARDAFFQIREALGSKDDSKS